MSSKSLTYYYNKKATIAAVLLILTAITYALFEFWYYPNHTQDIEQDIEQRSVEEAVNNFKDFQQEFVAKSQELSQQLVAALRSSDFEEQITDTEQRSQFWGYSVFKGATLVAWSEFGVQKLPFLMSQFTEFPVTRINRENNVTFIEYINSLKITEGDSLAEYFLVTRDKIQQSNILSIGYNSELEASELFSPDMIFPVKYSFFESLPSGLNYTKALPLSDSDSVGVAYTLSSDMDTFLAKQKQQLFLYRVGFWAISILFFSFFLLALSQNLKFWSSFFLKLFAVLLAWIFFVNVDFNINWTQILGMQDAISNTTFEVLYGYCIHALFIFLLCIVTFKALAIGSIEIQLDSSLLQVLSALTVGILNAALLFFIYSEAYQTIVSTSIQVLDLEIFPGITTLIFYFATGVLGISSMILLGLMGWFVIKLNDKETASVLLVLTTGFILGVITFSMTTIFDQNDLSLVLSSSLIFGTLLIFLYKAKRDPLLLINSSQLRLFLLISFITVGVSYMSIYKGYSERLEQQMQLAAQQFITEEATEAERIVRSLVVNLQQSLKGLTSERLNSGDPVIDNLFRETTQDLIMESWETFSISAQLVNNDGDIVSDYSSDLDSPAWTRAFNMLSLVIPFEAEQIRFENLRPIVRERPLNEATSNYSSFRRAWIPIYDESAIPTRIGWILCSVYRERPQFEKPLRAVIAMQNNEQWSSSISVTEYINGVSARKNIVGTPLELPGYLNLPESLIEDVMQDSVLYRDQVLSGQNIREYFIATSGQQIIRAATKLAGFNNHVFSILRFYFVVLVFGLLILALVYWQNDLIFISPNKRFRDRLIDRFIVASLACLMALIITTYYTIKEQNQKTVQDELLRKIENLTEAVSTSELESGNSRIPLNALASTLDADASLYRDQVVDISTTGQVYSQHLLPRLLPWDVYDSIYNNGNSQVTRRLTLGNQELLIGYQPWLTEAGEIAGIVSIPTFLEAPKFNEQLLTTTSYLIGLFVLIFSFFILIASLISTQLTSPLEALRDGLKKISGGNLETTLPVKSQDEIGSLINAYNIMVYRLKDLQSDLAEAEREAAWKEMAQQVAHEIKNPLTPMKLNLQHLEMQLSRSEGDFSDIKPKVKKLTKNMIEQIESLNKIASDFSKFAKPVEQEFKPVEINNLIKQISELYDTENDIRLKTTLHQQELWVEGVKDELRRVMINLVKNAREAMPNGGDIHLSTYYDRRQKMITISVTDSGEGIAEESRDRIFVPNFSTKSSGTGLGLAISKKIITEHGGQITFQSTPQKGSTFSILLPFLNSSNS